MNGFTFRAIIRVRRIEPATKHSSGLEASISARSKAGKEWVQYENDTVGLEAVLNQIKRTRALALDESATFDCVLVGWSYKSYDYYYGGYEYDAGTDVMHVRCIKTGQRSTRRMNRLCHRPQP